MTAQALYLGNAPHRAFVWLHEPSTPSGLGVVIAPPLGYEGIAMHRPLRHLAEQLARRGHLVVRVDYPGTGDAEGDDDDGDVLPRWTRALADAAALAVARGCRRVALYGLRSGALIATAAALGPAAPIDLLVLHAAPHSGRNYLRELRSFRRLAAAEGLDDGATKQRDPDAEESAGFVLWGPTAKSLGAIDLGALTKPPARAMLLVAREDQTSDGPLAKRLQALPVELTTVTPGDYVAMTLEPHLVVVPHAAWNAIGDWLDDHIPTGSVETRAAVESHVALDDERPVRFGPQQRLFGVLTSAAPANARGIGVVLLNPGAVHRVGPHRMYVRWARAWARLGYDVLRFDLGGIGDSAPDHGRAELAINDHASTADVDAAAAFLRARGDKRVIACGLCSGAFVAYQAARQSALDGVILLNSQAFGWPEERDERQASRDASSATYYRRALASAEKWRGLLRGNVRIVPIAKLAMRRLRATAQDTLRNAMRRGGLVQRGFGDDLEDVATRMRVSFVYSAGDPGVDYLAHHAGDTVERLRSEGRIDYELIDRADHTFTPPGSQQRVFDVLLRLLTTRFA